MFNGFKKTSIISKLKSLRELSMREIENIKNLEADDIPLEIKREKIKEIKDTLDTIKSQIDKLKEEINLEAGFKNN